MSVSLAYRSVHTTTPAHSACRWPKFEDCGYDFMHQADNQTSLIFELVLGLKAFDTKSIKLCLAQGRLKFFKNPKIRPPWKASKSSQITADSVHRSLCIPSAYSRDYLF